MIIGAGIAGLAMARQLAKRDLPFRIIERSDGSSRAGAGLGIPFNAVRAMVELGLDDQLTAVSHQVREIVYRRVDGSVLASADLRSAPFEYDRFLSLPRSELLRILAEGLRDKVEYNTAMVSVVGGGESVRVATSRWEEDFDVVIAGDGVASATRTQLFGETESAVDQGFQTWRFMANVPGHRQQPSYWFGNTDIFMAYPVNENTLYCYGHIYEGSRSFIRSGDDEADIRETFSHYANPVPHYLSRLTPGGIIPGRMVSSRSVRFHQGRVALIGDAAHGCSAILQQGAASAFEDAHCLASQLEAHGVAEALRSYERLREKRARWVFEASDAPIKLGKLGDNKLVRMVRDLVVRVGGPLNVRNWKKIATDGPLA